MLKGAIKRGLINSRSIVRLGKDTRTLVKACGQRCDGPKPKAYCQVMYGAF